MKKNIVFLLFFIGILQFETNMWSDQTIKIEEAKLNPFFFESYYPSQHRTRLEKIIFDKFSRIKFINKTNINLNVISGVKCKLYRLSNVGNPYPVEFISAETTKNTLMDQNQSLTINLPTTGWQYLYVDPPMNRYESLVFPYARLKQCFETPCKFPRNYDFFSKHSVLDNYCQSKITIKHPELTTSTSFDNISEGTYEIHDVRMPNGWLTGFRIDKVQ